MNLDELIGLMEKYTFKTSEDGELGEQEDAGAGASAGGSAGYPPVTKYELGLTRGVANTIDDKVTWKSLNKLVRGKANTLL